MSRSVNKAILVGHLGGPPDVKYTTSGKAVAKFSLATNSFVKDSQGDKTTWHNITCFDKIAELVSEYLGKGSKVYIDGRIENSSWEDKQTGEKKYRSEIIVNDIIFLDSKPASGNGTNSSQTEIADEDIPF
jgi:single-strand DNA-binding protein